MTRTGYPTKKVVWTVATQRASVDFASIDGGGPLDPLDVDSARRTICAHSSSVKEAMELMAMCGIAIGDVKVRIDYRRGDNTRTDGDRDIETPEVR